MDSSKESLEAFSKRFPIVSYASNLFTTERMLYCNAVSEVAAICEAKLLAWHLPNPSKPLLSLNMTSRAHRWEYSLEASKKSRPILVVIKPFHAPAWLLFPPNAATLRKVSER